MTNTIDVTGLPPELVQTIRELIGQLRTRAATQAPVQPSIFNLFGKAPVLRTGEDIERQIQDERDAWSDS